MRLILAASAAWLTGLGIAGFGMPGSVAYSLCKGSVDAVTQEEAAEKEEEEKKDEPETTTIKTSSLVVVEEIEANVESESNHELRIDMEQWTELEVREVVAQGARVKAGEMVLQFDTKEFEKKLREAKWDLDIAELDRQLAESENSYFERTWEMDREIAESDWAETQDDIQYWLNVGKDMMIESAKRSLQNSEFSVEYSLEELNQLEKMYAEDEITEESEKIVLERTRRELEDSKFWLKRNQQSTDRELSVEIPRTEKSQRRALRKGELEYNKRMVELPAERKRREIEFERSRFAFERKLEEHGELMADREKMVLKAPVDGVLYHGAFVRGKWVNESGSKLRQIEPEDALSNDVVAMTIVDPDRLQIRCALTEAQAAAIENGMIAHVSVPALPGKTFKATVRSVSDFPVEADSFDCTLGILENPGGLRPGMSCSLKMIVYQQPQAISVSTSLIFSDDEGISHYVYVWKDGEHEKREVKCGREKDGVREILSGLSVGEKILNAKPDENEHEQKMASPTHEFR